MHAVVEAQSGNSFWQAGLFYIVMWGSNLASTPIYTMLVVELSHHFDVELEPSV